MQSDSFLYAYIYIRDDDDEQIGKSMGYNKREINNKIKKYGRRLLRMFIEQAI